MWSNIVIFRTSLSTMSEPVPHVKMLLPFVVVDGHLVPLTPHQYVQSQTCPSSLRRGLNRLMNSVMEEYHNSHFDISALSSSSTLQHLPPPVAHRNGSGRQRRLIMSAGPSIVARQEFLARSPEGFQHQRSGDEWRDVPCDPASHGNGRLRSEGNLGLRSQKGEGHSHGYNGLTLQRSIGLPLARVCVRSSLETPSVPDTTTGCGTGAERNSAPALRGETPLGEQDRGDGDNVGGGNVTQSTSNDSLSSPDSLISDIVSTTAAVVGFQLCKEQLD